MRSRVLVFALITAALPINGQRSYGQRRGSRSTAPTDIGAYKNVVVAFRGKLKQLSKSEILIENTDQQIVSIRRSGKTKFFQGDKEVKPTYIDLESFVSVEATEDGEAKPSALRVIAEAITKQAGASK